MAYQRILFATDFSEINQDFLKRLEAIAKAHRAKLDVVHVITGMDTLSHVYQHTTHLKSTVEAEVLAKLKTFMSPVCQLIDHYHVIQGRPAEAICDLIKDKGYELLVTGSHGEQGYIAKLLGSVTRRLLNLSSCDVLVLHPEVNT